jgi:predicted cupin superfamily sugar epimerase
MHPRAQFLIAKLKLQPHPEGGFYREIHRSSLRVQPQDARPLRSAMTTIYFLLAGDAHSRWHCVTSDEVWHLYEGGPLELRIADPQLHRTEVIHLQSVSASNGPVAVVSAGHWQSARPMGDYALVGCTVGPGFEFSDFILLRDSPTLAKRLSDPMDISLL